MDYTVWYTNMVRYVTCSPFKRGCAAILDVAFVAPLHSPTYGTVRETIKIRCMIECGLYDKVQ